MRGGRDDARSCFLMTAADQLRLSQELTGSAVLAGVTLLLSHRDHGYPSGEASHHGYKASLAAGDNTSY